MPELLKQKKSAVTLPQRGIYPKAENTIRIMTFNLLCKGSGEHEMKNRTGIAAQTIAEYLPDSVGVQEATPDWMKALKRLLPEYGYIGAGRDNGRARGEFAAVFYRKDTYKAVDSGTFWISETPGKPSMGWDAVCKRVCTWAILENLHTGKQYAHVNTHLDHKGDKAREYGVKMILDKAADFSMPAVCTGDFNLTEDTDYYAELTGSFLRDAKRSAPDTMSHATFQSFGKPLNERDVIDYILVNNQFSPLVYRVVTAGINGMPVSDHFPVYADLVLNNG